jgi:DNA (cytosine-5)-methyltransferase 1
MASSAARTMLPSPMRQITAKSFMGHLEMKRPLLLDLFCGAGGCSVGYHRAGFDVVGIDNRPQPRYPFPFIQGDALRPQVDLREFDAIHASPPCQHYSVLSKMNKHKTYPDLVQPIRAMLEASGLPWVIENVMGAPLRNAIKLCGSQFGLETTTALHGKVHLRRHRLFESNYLLTQAKPCSCRGRLHVPVFGHGAGGVKHSRMRGKGVAQAAREVMGIDWMNRHELDQSIPPAYTEFIGRQLIRILENMSA